MIYFFSSLCYYAKVAYRNAFFTASVKHRKGTNMNKKIVSGYIFAILSAVIYGCMPLMAKYIYMDGVTPTTLVFLRNFLALPILAVLALMQKKTLKIPLRAMPSLAIISLFGCCLTPILLFMSYNYISSGTATVFHFVYPCLVLLIGAMFLKKKLKAATIISVAVCFIGICMFYNSADTFNLTGGALAVLSGLTFAIYVAMLPTFKYKEVSGFLFTFYVIAISSVATFIVGLCTKSLSFPATLRGWGLCVLFAIAVTAIAVVLFQESAFRIGSEKTSILSALEPTTSVIIGILVFSEPASVRSVIGTVLVILAGIIIAISDMKSKKV